MYATERQERIAAQVRSDGRVSVAELAKDLDVTAETVRRDLDQLEALGLLRRVHGGAVAAGRSSVLEASLDERRGLGVSAKRRIADAALRMLPSGFTGSVLVDAGSTTASFAERLVDWGRPGEVLPVITNAVPIVAALAAAPSLEVHQLGGRVRGITAAAVGSETVAALERIRPDLAFIGTNGVSADFGLSTPDELEGAVKTAMVRSARRVVVLADASKLGEESLFRFATLDEVDTLVTDAAPDAILAAALADSGVEVVFA